MPKLQINMRVSSQSDATAIRKFWFVCKRVDILIYGIYVYGYIYIYVTYVHTYIYVCENKSMRLWFRGFSALLCIAPQIYVYIHTYMFVFAVIFLSLNIHENVCVWKRVIFCTNLFFVFLLWIFFPGAFSCLSESTENIIIKKKN